MTPTPPTAPSFRVADGEVWIYRLFDVADAIDLARAEQLGGAPAARLAMDGAQSASALEFPRAPLHVSMGRRQVPLGSGARTAQASAHVFDYGVVSVRYRVAIPAGTALEALVPLAEELLEGPTAELDAAARAHAGEVAAALGTALERPHEWEGLESYHVFFVKAFEGPGITAQRLLAEAPIPALLLGETSPVRLSEAERQDVLSHQFSYLENDLTVIHWNSALVVEPSGLEDVPDLLEFATAHLLELRFYDALLDRELHRIYDELEGGGSPITHLVTRKYRRLQRRTAALLLELSEMIERLENAVKIVGDFYLARLYQAAVKRFRLASWQETVLRKQKLVAEVNDLTGDSADTSRSELLEIVIILLIAYEIIAAFVVR
ncbi:MAG: hypothetical protein IPQ24_13160 [Anaeromyxobacter sp.]|nr:hypothetical protein [Anaeromyxobacter sp.]